MQESLIEARKKKTRIKNPYITYTTGDIAYNIKQFNKHMGTDFNNPSTEEAKQANNMLGNTTSDSDTGDMGGTDIAAGAESLGGSEGAMGESLQLNEAKRYVKRYLIRPQKIYCSNKAEILKALIDIGDENCSVYTLKNLKDNNDIHKLTSHDIIYYYDDGILYDKNHVKVMDYDLYIKHEENRKKYADEPNLKNKQVQDEYDDRLTKATELDEAFSLDFDDINVYGETLREAVDLTTCCICGEPLEGYGNNPAPVKAEGKCCDACNLKFVIPARLEDLKSDEG